MKSIIALLLALCLLTGCAPQQENAATVPTETSVPTEATAEPAAEEAAVPVTAETTPEIPYVSRYSQVTQIQLSDDGIRVDGGEETERVYTSRDIIYYEDKDTYESGNPYGEGEAHERHSAQEAQAHTVVNITAPGAYRVSGTLSLGQIRVDLGEDARSDPNAVVELILADADITCTVAPAVLFLNVYECDGDWSVETAQMTVDTTAAGANLVLEGSNTVTGSHVARIYKDNAEEKKLWKQDGAVYSYMSMNVFGPGSLDITADNEGLDTELHLTVNGGNLAIRSQDDGINTNEDGVSVTAINAGTVHIIAGLGAEGDGIDSNGFLVINGGTVVASANPGADAGMDADLGCYINGGFVVALGSTMDWAESDSGQVTMNLQFSANQSAEAAVVVTREDGTVIFAYDPSADEVLQENRRVYSGAILSCANFHVGQTYRVYVDAEVTGREQGGVYDPTTVTGYTPGTQMSYTGTDVRMGPGGMGPMGGTEPPEGLDPGQLQEGEMLTMPQGMELPPEGMAQGERPEPPEGMEQGRRPEDMERPEGFDPAQGSQGGMTGRTGEGNTAFYMQDKVNFFSGLCEKDALT